MRRSLLCSALLLAIALLAGCGNKGPLYMPAAQPGGTVSPAASAPAPAPAQSSALPG